jgi:transcriptional regulator with XRE-family HTH domain
MTGDELKRRRIEAGLSQSRLAEELGMSIQIVSAWEHGHRNIPPFRLPAIERALLATTVVWDGTGVLVLSWH